MSVTARANGWRGFDGIAERIKPDPEFGGDRGWLYRCDGLPSWSGCGNEILLRRRWTTVGRKRDGWEVMYGTNGPDDPGDDGKGNDLDVVLTFCPRCAEHVRNFEEHRTEPDSPASDEGKA